MHHVQRNNLSIKPNILRRFARRAEGVCPLEDAMAETEGVVMAYLMTGVIVCLLSAGMWQYLRLLK